MTNRPAQSPLPPPMAMMQLLFGKQLTYSLSGVARLGVADHMDGTARPVEEIAAKCGAHAPSLYRVMRMLAGFGVFKEGRPRHIAECLRTGGDGVSEAYGKQIWEVLAERPGQCETFQRAMTNSTSVAADAIVEAYDFSGVRRLADVGGGHGLLLAAVLRRYPKMQGVLFDRPEVVGSVPKDQFAGCGGGTAAG